jgi:addiction module RelB/DinJ family antitoxin
MDRELKEKAEKLYSELGMSMTTAINVFFRQSVRQGRVPFDISLASGGGTDKLESLEYLLNFTSEKRSINTKFNRESLYDR